MRTAGSDKAELAVLRPHDFPEGADLRLVGSYIINLLKDQGLCDEPGKVQGWDKLLKWRQAAKKLRATVTVEEAIVAAVP